MDFLLGIGLESNKKPRIAAGVPCFFEGGDREWLFIYPRFIIAKKCVQSMTAL